MHLSGQTPLYRARNLEKYLGIESIYLKLEGSNPTGHKNDRITESLIRFAITKGYENMLIHGSDRYIRSGIYFAKNLGIACTIAISDKRKISKYIKDDISIEWLNLKEDTVDNEQEWLGAYATSNNMFLLSEFDKKPFVRSLAIQEMMEETIQKINAPTDIWTQVRGGFTAKSIYHEVVRSWIKGSVESIPEFHCGIASNAIVDEEFVTSSQSEMVSISSEQLGNATKLLKKIENVTISNDEAYAFAAFLESNNQKNGTHIIFLNDGKSDITITEITNRKDFDVKAFVDTTRELLKPYNDSIGETTDAIQEALDSGFIFTATRKDELHGICIVVNMGFETFIPTYHLAYIGVKPGNSGRGVATELINMAIEKTNGKLSLHVDIPNKHAKKLYEKMGFVHKYERMIYKE